MSNPNQFIQLIPFQDELLALDLEGKIWRIRGITFEWGPPVVELLVESPRGF